MTPTDPTVEKPHTAVPPNLEGSASECKPVDSRRQIPRSWGFVMLTLFEFHGYLAVPEMLKKYRKK